LKNSLVVWDEDYIKRIDTGEQRELSCGYRYVADMRPGEINGEKYDGRMTEIVGNHVALVAQGRAGPDVIVGDSKLKERKPMIKTKALGSRHALMVQGALVGHLAPILAADASIDLGAVLNGVNQKNFRQRKPAILKALETATDGKLAGDAKLGAAAVLDSFDHVRLAKDEAEKDEDAEDEEKDEDAKDEEKDDDAVAGGDEEKDEDAKDEEKDEEEANASDRGARDSRPRHLVRDQRRQGGRGKDRQALDQAVIVRQARDAVRNEFRAIDQAKADVKPYVGEIAGDVGSAAEIYRLALDQAIEDGVPVNLDGVHPSAYPALVKLLPLPGARGGKAKSERLAADAKAASNFMSRYPAAASARVM
jgi:hypothetical protein